jgi:hypothetical protein
MKSILNFFITLFDDKKYKLFFLPLVLIILFGILGYYGVMKERPQSIHQWAQVDRASVARNYAQEDMNFFKPRVHCSTNTSGITGIEFPFVNYIAAIFYKIFGYHEFWYRFVLLLIISIGLIYAHKLGILITGNYFGALLITLIWYLSPILNYYSPSFIPDTASVGFILISWYFIFNFLKHHQKSSIYLWAVFACIASLIKVTSLISPTSILILVICDQLKLFGFKNEIKNKQKIYISVLIIYFFVFIWYQYAAWLTKNYGTFIFTLTIHPTFDLAKISEIWSSIRGNWLPYYYSYTFYILLGISAIFILIFNKKANKHLLFLTILCYIGSVIYIILFLEQFLHHDYYIITILPTIFLHLLTVSSILKELDFKFKPLILTIIGLSIFIFSIIHSKTQFKNRYTEGWQNDPIVTFKKYFTIEDRLRDLGIKWQDKVASFYDYSPNLTLYLMNQKGWPVSNSSSDVYIKKALYDCKYAIVNDINAINNKSYSYCFNNLIGFYNGVYVFNLDSTSWEEGNNRTIPSIFDCDTLICDIETDDNLKFLYSKKSIKAEGFDTRSDSIAKSGMYSVRINETNPYSLGTKLKGIKPGDIIEVSIWRYSKTEKGAIVLSVNGDNGFVSGTETPDSTAPNGWKRLRFDVSFNRPPFNDEVIIYTHNPQKEPAFFDDLSIVKKKLKNLSQ